MAHCHIKTINGHTVVTSESYSMYKTGNMFMKWSPFHHIIIVHLLRSRKQLLSPVNQLEPILIVSVIGPHGWGRPGRLTPDHPHETGVCVLKIPTTKHNATCCLWFILFTSLLPSVPAVAPVVLSLVVTPFSRNSPNKLSWNPSCWRMVGSEISVLWEQVKKCRYKWVIETKLKTYSTWESCRIYSSQLFEIWALFTGNTKM